MTDIVIYEGINELNVQMEPRVAPPPGKGLIWGFVTDSLTGAAVPDVKITLDGLVRYTEWAGQYEFRDLDIRQYQIVFSKEGYETVTRYATPDIQLNIDLPPIVPTEPELVYAYPAQAQVAPGGTGYIIYKVGIPDITTGYQLIFIFHLEGVSCYDYEVFYEGATAGYYEGSASIKFNIPVGTYRLLSTCELYRDGTLVKTYWSNVDTGEKITVALGAPPIARLTGVVTDAYGGYPLEGVKVTIQGIVDYTNASGEYSFIGLTPGTPYNGTLTFEKEGYETITESNYFLPEGSHKHGVKMEPITVPIAPCVYCGATFTSEAALVSHMEASHPEKPYIVYAYLYKSQISCYTRSKVYFKVYFPTVPETPTMGYYSMDFYWMPETIAAVHVHSVAGAPARFYEGEQDSAHLRIRGVYALYSKCVYKLRFTGDILQTFWEDVDTGLRITVI